MAGAVKTSGVPLKGRCLLTIIFNESGSAEFFPSGDPVELADRLYTLARHLDTHPDTINCAAGLHNQDEHPPGTCRGRRRVNA